MTESSAPQPDHRKVRAGLAVISIVVIVAAVLFVVVDDPIGRSIMFAVAILGIVRAYLLSRSLRQD
jgi:hypothetical protein